MLNADRYFSPIPAVREIARELYREVATLPLVCPHGHVDPRLLALDEPFPDPAALIVIPDHYIVRMLYSQGVAMEALGIPRTDGSPVERDPRRIWQLFGDHFHLFRGTPSGAWLTQEFDDVFGISRAAERAIGDADLRRNREPLARARVPAARPVRSIQHRSALHDRCRNRLARTSCTDPRVGLEGRRASDVPARSRDQHPASAVARTKSTGWQRQRRKRLTTYASYIRALEERRAFFKTAGATATDHAAETPFTAELSPHEAASIFERALAGRATAEDARAFTGHMLMEMARMSTEDGLVMQLHPGSDRNHNAVVFERFGPDRGCDIPLATEYTRNLKPLLNKYGNDPRLTLVLFTLDETTYSRELAPLAGHYPALRLGPPWWFHDSIEGMTRFRYQVTETAGIYNTAGFNDDTRAFPSIPARHDVARRVDANFLADLVSRHIVTIDDASEMIRELSYGLAKRTYRL